jgi:hypothetical protein
LKLKYLEKYLPLIFNHIQIELAYNGGVARFFRSLSCIFAVLVAHACQAAGFYSYSNAIQFVAYLEEDPIWVIFDPDIETSYYNSIDGKGSVEIIIDEKLKLSLQCHKADPDSELMAETEGYAVFGQDMLSKYEFLFTLHTGEVELLPIESPKSKEFQSIAKLLLNQVKGLDRNSQGFKAFPTLAWSGVRNSLPKETFFTRSWDNGSIAVIACSNGLSPTLIVQDKRTETDVFGLTEWGYEEILVRFGAGDEAKVWAKNPIENSSSFIGMMIGTPTYEKDNSLFINDEVLDIETDENDEGGDLQLFKVNGLNVDHLWKSYVEMSNGDRLDLLKTLFETKKVTVGDQNDNQDLLLDVEVINNELYSSYEKASWHRRKPLKFNPLSSKLRLMPYRPSH